MLSKPQSQEITHVIDCDCNENVWVSVQIIPPTAPEIGIVMAKRRLTPALALNHIISYFSLEPGTSGKWL